MSPLILPGLSFFQRKCRKPGGPCNRVRSTSGRAASAVPGTTLRGLGVGVRPPASPFFLVPRGPSRCAVTPTPFLRLDPRPGLAVPADRWPRRAALKKRNTSGAVHPGLPPRPAQRPDGAGKSPAALAAHVAAAANLSTRAILGSEPPDPTCVARGGARPRGGATWPRGAGQEAEGGPREAGAGPVRLRYGGGGAGAGPSIFTRQVLKPLSTAKADP